MATVVEGDPKAPFPIATTPRCREGRYSFPRFLHFTLDTYLIILSVKQGSIKYHFLNLWFHSTWDWILVSRAFGKQSIYEANEPDTGIMVRVFANGMGDLGSIGDVSRCLSRTFPSKYQKNGSALSETVGRTLEYQKGLK